MTTIYTNLYTQRYVGKTSAQKTQQVQCFDQTENDRLLEQISPV